MRDLYEGNFKDGWKYYEFRRSSLNNLYSDINKWNGESLKERKILVERKCHINLGVVAMHQK